MQAKALMKQLMMSLPEGSTCYWLIKRENAQRRMQKLDEIPASEDTDIYEEIVLKHGPGNYLVWLYNNNDQRISPDPIRFLIRGEGESEDEEDDDEVEEKIDMKQEIFKQIKDSLEMSQLLNLKKQFEQTNSNTPKEKEEKKDDESIRYIRELERKLEERDRKQEERDRKQEERDRRLEEKIANQNNQNNIMAVFAKMVESSNTAASENQKLMMQMNNDSNKLMMQLMKKDDSNDMMKSPLFVEVFKKAIAPPPQQKSFVDESMPKVFDFVMSSNAKAMAKMMDMQFEHGQNDIFFQRMKAFQGMAESLVPHAKDLFVKLASIKAMKETKKEELKSNKNDDANKRETNQANNTQENNAQPKEEPKPNPRPKQKIRRVKKHNDPETKAQEEQIDEVELRAFLFDIHEKIVLGEDIDKIEEEIKQKPGAVQEIKRNEQLQDFAESEGGKVKELFERLKNAS